jgi:hypothetical protein
VSTVLLFWIFFLDGLSFVTLDTFISSLHDSVCTEQVFFCSKYEWKDMNAEVPRTVRCLTKSVFQNNFGVANNQPLFAVATSRSPSNSSLPVQGVFDCLLYLGEYYLHRHDTAAWGRKEWICGHPDLVLCLFALMRLASLHNFLNCTLSFSV